MKKIAFLFIAYMPLLLIAQQKGIQWTEGFTWSQILAKAKAENKYIFLDCFTTWCGPCHAMDKDVYPNEEVGKQLNEKFIAVKVQMDRTRFDNELVKKWYNEAKRIERNYSVTAFPTFLFFFPDGMPMHRAIGYRSPDEFISLVKDALVPEKQYYALLKDYQPGKFDTSELKGLARALRKSGGELASRMAIEYLSLIPEAQLKNEDNISLMVDFKTNPQMQEFVIKHFKAITGKTLSTPTNITLIRNFSSVNPIRENILNGLASLNSQELRKNLPLLSIFKKEAKAKEIADIYIKSLKLDNIFAKENLTFLAEFTKSSRDRGFKIFYQNQDRIDKVIKSKGYARATVINIIISEEYDSFYQDAVKKGTDNIAWQTIFQTVEKKYSRAIAEQLDTHVKSSLYEYFAKKQDRYWPEYIDYYIQKVEKYGTDTTGPQRQFLDAMLLNNFVFEAIFYHSTDTNQMKVGLKWMEGVIRRNPREANNIDTYANLLYKTGKIKEAIQWQEKAVQTAMEEKQEWVLPSLQGNLAKMKNGEPTWIKEANN